MYGVMSHFVNLSPAPNTRKGKRAVQKGQMESQRGLLAFHALHRLDFSPFLLLLLFEKFKYHPSFDLFMCRPRGNSIHFANNAQRGHAARAGKG